MIRGREGYQKGPKMSTDLSEKSIEWLNEYIEWLEQRIEVAQADGYNGAAGSLARDLSLALAERSQRTGRKVEH